LWIIKGWVYSAQYFYDHRNKNLYLYRWMTFSVSWIRNCMLTGHQLQLVVPQLLWLQRQTQPANGLQNTGRGRLWGGWMTLYPHLLSNQKGKHAFVPIKIPFIFAKWKFPSQFVPLSGLLNLSIGSNFHLSIYERNWKFDGWIDMKSDGPNY